VVFLFGAASFLGAALLFLIEPMLAKLVLPAFGGSPMVWNTSTLFFQVLLLGGYAYVHVSTRRLGSRRQPWLHMGLLVLPLLVLPVALPADTAPPADGEPALWLLRVLALAAGLPFAMLATTGPLLQRWFSWTDHRRAQDAATTARVLPNPRRELVQNRHVAARVPAVRMRICVAAPARC
jgi:hypothetical protein